MPGFVMRLLRESNIFSRSMLLYGIGLIIAAWSRSGQRETGASVKIDFRGGRVVVTGAGGGVGRALVDALSGANARIVACDVEGADLSSPSIVERHAFDLLDQPAVERAAQVILAGGAPCAVISNAGWTRAETFEAVTVDALDREMSLNFRNAAILSQALVPAMRDHPGGASFVFVSSVNALSHFGNPAYSAAKAALNAWMRAIATEEGLHGIRANAVLPGSIRTGAWDHRIAEKPEILAKVRELYPLGRLVEAAEVARAAVFLASSAASGITGATLNVDAGLSAGNLPFLDLISN